MAVHANHPQYIQPRESMLLASQKFLLSGQFDYAQGLLFGERIIVRAPLDEICRQDRIAMRTFKEQMESFLPQVQTVTPAFSLVYI